MVFQLHLKSMGKSDGLSLNWQTPAIALQADAFYRSRCL